MEIIHGGDIYGYRDILDFSVNINPLGISESVKNALIENIDCIGVYPDPLCRDLRRAAAEKENVDFESVICSNGAADMLYSVMAALMPKNVMTIIPTFSEYERAALSIGAKMSYFRLYEADGFELNEGILDKITDFIDMLIICNPNNPTGITADKALMGEIIKKCQKCGVFLIIDESFMDFVQDNQSCIEFTKSFKNLMIIKSFTKIYAMPGLRLGCGICSDGALPEEIYRKRQPWCVSAVAQTAGKAALEEDIIADVINITNSERKYMMSEFEKMGIKYFKSNVNYILFKTNKGLKEKLIGKNILIRDCSNFRGLEEGFYRTALKRHEENMILINAVKEVN